MKSIEIPNHLIYHHPSTISVTCGFLTSVQHGRPLEVAHTHGGSGLHRGTQWHHTL